MLGFAVDVTERVRTRQRAEALQAELLATAQRQVQERESFYRVFDQTAALVGLLRGPHHRFDYVNPAFQQLFAGRPLAGLDYATALPDAAAQGFVVQLDEVYRTGEPYVSHETPIALQPPGGEPTAHYLDVTYQPLRDAHGQTTGVQAFVLDVTERVHTRQINRNQRSPWRFAV